MDYDSTPLTATFTAGSISTIVNVPVIKDVIAEGSETFNLIFIIPSSLKDQIMSGTITEAVGNITDNTSKKIHYNNLFNLVVSCYFEIW